jgi:hypothetical protein
VARAARDPRREAARLGLLILASACAASQEPPGGPPDFTPPVLREIRPESLAVLPGFHDPVEFDFDEVLNERSAPNLADLFVVSPRHKEIKVSWKRTRLEVKPKDGWRPNAVYRVVMLPGLSDLRNNRYKGRAEVVFSTGPPIPDTRLDATVVDWDAGRIAPKGLLEAYPLPITGDSTAYIASADSTGDAALTRVPPGRYLVFGVVDDNGNQRRDRREAFDSATVQIDSTGSATFWSFVHDTVGPQLRDATRVDSVTARITFSQRLAPTMTISGAVDVRLLPDSTPVALTAVWTTGVYDSVAAGEAAVRDSLRRLAADSAARADSLRRDSTRADTARAGVRDTAAMRADTARPPQGVAPPRPTPRAGPPRPAGAPVPRGGPEERRGGVAPAAPDTGRVAALLKERPKLSDQLVLRFAEPLVAGQRYVIDATAVNLNGATSTSRTLLAIPAPDSTQAPAK